MHKFIYVYVYIQICVCVCVCVCTVYCSYFKLTNIFLSSCHFAYSRIMSKKK